MSTKPWRIYRYNQPHFAKQVAALNRHAEPAASRIAAVAEIIATVRRDGDEALVKFAKKWDGVDMAKTACCCLRARRSRPQPCTPRSNMP